MIRVLQVIGSMNRGGAEAMIMNLYRNIDRNQVQFDFLVRKGAPKGLFEDEIEKLGGKIYRIKDFNGYNIFSFYSDCKKFFNAHPEYKVVHGQIGSSAAIYLKAAKNAGCFTIAHSHSASGVRTFQDFLYHVFSYPTRYVADWLFGCSTEAGIARYGKKAVMSDKYQNFHNAIEVEKFIYSPDVRTNIRKQLGLDENIVLLGAVGRVTPPKNPYRIIDLFKNAVERYPNVRCIWLGIGEMSDEINEYIKRQGVEDRVNMAGVVSNVNEYMQAMDCLLFPSLWEGLPVTVIESQTAGLPSVLADTISKEVEITKLVSWHNLSESDDVWVDTAMQLSQQARGHRKSPIIDVRAHGYDIKTTAKWLETFYMEKYEQSEGIRSKNTNK